MPNLIFFFRKPHSHSTHKYIIMLRVTAQRALRRATVSLRNGNTTATSNNAKQQLQKRSMSGGGSIEEEIGRQSFFFFLSLPIIFSFSLSPDERVTIEKRSLSLTYSSIVIKTAEMNKWRTVTFLAIPSSVRRVWRVLVRERGTRPRRGTTGVFVPEEKVARAVAVGRRFGFVRVSQGRRRTPLNVNFF